jgi:excisionase family DNA binding protein
MTKSTSRPQEAPEGLATIREAAEFLRVSRATVYVLMDEGRLPSHKIGKSRRVSWTGLRRLLDESKV